jgi:hypothetical protein
MAFSSGRRQPFTTCQRTLGNSPGKSGLSPRQERAWLSRWQRLLTSNEAEQETATSATTVKPGDEACVDAEWQTYAERFWRTPLTTHGGGFVTSLLLVLALHTWPDWEGAVARGTGWRYASIRWLATLVSLNTGGRKVHIGALTLALSRRERGHAQQISPGDGALDGRGK